MDRQEWPEPYRRASYTYDPVGNRLYLAFDGQSTSYSYEGLNRLTRADQVTYSYDVHGNVVERVDADGRVQYTYDSRQQLTRVDFPDGTSVSYAYDAFGRRVMRDETYWHNNGRLRSDVVHYFYDGLEVLKEYGGTPGEGRPPLAEYWRANGRVVAKRLYGNPTRPGPGNDDFLFTRGGLLYYHYDALGTVQALADRHGDVLAQYYYDAYGQPWAGPLGAYNAYGLTGKELDPKTGLYYFGARWYDPQVGRWMSQDPARDGLNWYAYVGNSPTAYVDLWGLERIAGENIMGTVVQPGDTLSGMALEFHGDASLAGEIAAYNGIEDPNRIQVGQEILFPPHLNDQLTGWGPNASPDPFGNAAIALGSVGTVAATKAVAASGPVARAVASVASAWDRARAWVSQIGNRAGTAVGRTSPNAYDIARDGGKHAGFYRQYLDRSTAELQRGITSFNRQIAEHLDKINNPQSHIRNFGSLHPDHQRHLLEAKWPSDIARLQEQLVILENILKNR